MNQLSSFPHLGFIWILRWSFPLLLFGCGGVETTFIKKVEADFSSQPFVSEKILTESEIRHLPNPVKNYLRFTGVIGKIHPQNMRIVFEELMYKSPEARPMDSSSEQYNFFNFPSRHFYMKANMMGVPFRVLHSYSNERATMLVRVFSLFDVVDLDGEELTMAETVTLLNDLCLFAPAALVHKNISWEKIDSLSTKIYFVNGKYKVSATLYFNQKGELIEFVSEDRSALQDDGSLRKARWTTPIRDYKEFNGIKVPTYGEAIWNYPEGDFTYGKFFLKNIDYNLKGYKKE
ncbi:hypothetical protein ND861_12220 [Leptospira sp. 2 VSF19]|uniref:Lipoprotein n=1 Tax=Leptospira soteropolitanensis TaxID=2950025 RepID=A0AAW5VQW5_9LEPT|nr:DUF6544 family protein [Leptospira soteropolitanensis]MCW7493404.1 hypothetical protein [Leptospira soteropolitanensis]MCW7501064.1 hypothetical protein [Leptospira soteropolitanensis]MCW7523256.1 hypothetical protein [Leptospira soteropolitanensis]MCW7527117.1 hypothetical protein [Leptospira soteropolitanensis]MCW7530974.1 hypothetical protein [Leptospira soteropolitanensis]